MYKRIIALVISFTLVFEQSGFAQVAPQLPLPVYLQNILPADTFRPLHLRGLAMDQATKQIKLVVNPGDLKQADAKQTQANNQKAAEYFSIGLKLPDSMFWVNLRPDAADQVIDPYLSQTDLGKVLLEADLQLKKDLAKFTNPNTKEGRAYWTKLYDKAESLYGQQNLEIPTYTRPWIVPGDVILSESKDGLYIYKANLKVMLEQDYLKNAPTNQNSNDLRAQQLNAYSSQLIRELILPRLTREVNASKRYAELRQVYYSLILAQWVKSKLRVQSKSNDLTSYGLETMDLSGLTSTKAWDKNTYFQSYKQSFQQGEYRIQETVSAANGITIRNYVSGGISIASVLKSIPGVNAVSNGLNIGGAYLKELPAQLSQSVKLNSILANIGIIDPLKQQAEPKTDGGRMQAFYLLSLGMLAVVGIANVVATHNIMLCYPHEQMSSAVQAVSIFMETFGLGFIVISVLGMVSGLLNWSKLEKGITNTEAYLYMICASLWCYGWLMPVFWTAAHYNALLPSLPDLGDGFYLMNMVGGVTSGLFLLVTLASYLESDGGFNRGAIKVNMLKNFLNNPGAIDYFYRYMDRHYKGIGLIITDLDKGKSFRQDIENGCEEIFKMHGDEVELTFDNLLQVKKLTSDEFRHILMLVRFIQDKKSMLEGSSVIVDGGRTGYEKELYRQDMRQKFQKLEERLKSNPQDKDLREKVLFEAIKTKENNPEPISIDEISREFGRSLLQEFVTKQQYSKDEIRQIIVDKGKNLLSYNQEERNKLVAVGSVVGICAVIIASALIQNIYLLFTGVVAIGGVISYLIAKTIKHWNAQNAISELEQLQGVSDGGSNYGQQVLSVISEAKSKQEAEKDLLPILKDYNYDQYKAGELNKYDQRVIDDMAQDIWDMVLHLDVPQINQIRDIALEKCFIDAQPVINNQSILQEEVASSAVDKLKVLGLGALILSLGLGGAVAADNIGGFGIFKTLFPEWQVKTLNKISDLNTVWQLPQYVSKIHTQDNAAAVYVTTADDSTYGAWMMGNNTDKLAPYGANALIYQDTQGPDFHEYMSYPASIDEALMSGYSKDPVNMAAAAGLVDEVFYVIPQEQMQLWKNNNSDHRHWSPEYNGSNTFDLYATTVTVKENGTQYTWSYFGPQEPTEEKINNDMQQRGRDFNMKFEVQGIGPVHHVVMHVVTAEELQQHKFGKPVILHMDDAYFLNEANNDQRLAKAKIDTFSKMLYWMGAKPAVTTIKSNQNINLTDNIVRSLSYADAIELDPDFNDGGFKDNVLQNLLRDSNKIDRVLKNIEELSYLDCWRIISEVEFQQNIDAELAGLSYSEKVLLANKLGKKIKTEFFNTDIAIQMAIFGGYGIAGAVIWPAMYYILASSIQLGPLVMLVVMGASFGAMINFARVVAVDVLGGGTVNSLEYSKNKLRLIKENIEASSKNDGGIDRMGRWGALHLDIRQDQEFFLDFINWLNQQRDIFEKLAVKDNEAFVQQVKDYFVANKVTVPVLQQLVVNSLLEITLSEGAFYALTRLLIRDPEIEMLRGILNAAQEELTNDGGGSAQAYRDASNSVGGIDLRATLSQASLATPASVSVQQIAMQSGMLNANLTAVRDELFSKIKNAKSTQELPCQELKQYLAVCTVKGDKAQELKQQVSACIMQVLEKEEQAGLTSSSQMQEVLAVL